MADDLINPEWDELLENRGEGAILLLLANSNWTGAGSQSAIPGLPSTIDRGYAEAWLDRKAKERDRLAAAQASINLRWTKIAAWAAIISVVVGFIGAVVGALAWWFPR
jgi:hypothetical protein